MLITKKIKYMYLLVYMYLLTFQKTYDVFVTMRQFQIFERYDIRNIHINIIKYLCKILKKKILE